MTLQQKLQLAIETQHQEIQRLSSVVKDELPAAALRLKQLEGLLDQLVNNPIVEKGYAQVRALGISLDTD